MRSVWHESSHTPLWLRVIGVAALAGLVVVTLKAVPEVRRYWRIRRM
jgi:hypothetical protein